MMNYKHFHQGKEKYSLIYNDSNTVEGDLRCSSGSKYAVNQLLFYKTCDLRFYDGFVYLQPQSLFYQQDWNSFIF